MKIYQNILIPEADRLRELRQPAGARDDGHLAERQVRRGHHRPPILCELINIITKAHEAKKGGSAQYVIGNDGYNKVLFNISSGKLPNGWRTSRS